MNTSELVITIQAIPGDRPPKCDYPWQPCGATARWLVNDSEETIGEADPICDWHVGTLVARLINDERDK